MRTCRILIFLIMLGATTAGAQSVPFLKQGDRVCFIGNSITYAGGFLHYINLFFATRYPGLNVEVINCGVPGNKAAQVLARMNTDILPKHPTVCVLMLGMNDVRKELYTPEAALQAGIKLKRQEALDIYRRDYDQVIRILLKQGSRVLLQTPTIYDEGANLKDQRLPGRNEALRKCARIVKQLAEKYGLQVVDYWSPMQEITSRLQMKDARHTIIGPDRVHPGPVGHFIMSYIFLKTIVPATPVAALSLNVSRPVESTAVSNFSKTKSTIGFTWKETALPFPVPPEAAGALSLVPFTKVFNQEILRVQFLSSGKYQLLVDKDSAGVFDQEQLSAGIDLAQNRATPQYRQAQEVLECFRELWAAEGRLRYVAALETGRAPLKNARNLEEVEQYFTTWIAEVKNTASKEYKDRLSLRNDFLNTKRSEPQIIQQIQELRKQIRSLNQPQAHHYEIIRYEAGK